MSERKQLNLLPFSPGIVDCHNRQTDRQINRHTQIEAQTDRQTDRQTKAQRQTRQRIRRQTHTHTEKTDTGREPETLSTSA